MTTLADMLLERAQTHPHSLAVVDDRQSLTFAELVQQSTKLAIYLRHLGVTSDSRVGLFVEPSQDLMVGVWGILIAGGAYLPLSPEYPEERLRYMLDDSETKVVVAQEELADTAAALASPNTRIVTLRQAHEFARSTPHGTVRGGASARHLAYVIYTSGSTGRPKGVMIEHRSIVSQMHWLGSEYGLDESKVVLQKTPMSFDAAQWEILAPACGSTVVMGPPGVHRDPDALIASVRKHRVTTLQCVPTLLRALLEMDDFAKCESLTQVFSGGEALSKHVATRCLAMLPGCQLANLYGPTECTINSCAYTIDPLTVGSGPDAIPIGTPVNLTECYILDDSMAPVAAGEIGELYISGIQVARGYLNRPDLTTRRFIPNPLSTHPLYARLYRTGDLAFSTSDGVMHFAGRVDNQIKLRGYRVELDEVRLAIEAHNWVRHAAVTVTEDPRTAAVSLTAFIELNPNEAALMDQGNAGAHHQSKGSRLQVRAQLSNPGRRDEADLQGRPFVELPGRTPPEAHRRKAFARKTYRFFNGGEVKEADIRHLLAKRSVGTGSRGLETLRFTEIGEILRYFGQFHSEDRLLAKHAYASPGSLYATQMYVEARGLAGIRNGLHYYDPVQHRLVLMAKRNHTGIVKFKLHFVGKTSAIKPVYKHNIREVLEIEAGHMVGLFEEILPDYGLNIFPTRFMPSIKDKLDCAAEDHYLGSFEVAPYAVPRPEDTFDIYVQTHPNKVADLPAGQYLYRKGELHLISDELIQRKHVIAINQQVYDRASIGITLISHSRQDWMSYVDLGRKLQRLEMNDLNLGFMSSGYSSKTGHDLHTATRMASILNACGRTGGPSYFFLGGRVTDEQMFSEGMHEDIVHMKGPAEMVRDDLANLLPHYMMPNRVMIIDRVPQTSNGKIDHHTLRALASAAAAAVDDRPPVEARTDAERRISDIWKRVLKRDVASMHDDFFASGGDSLVAVGLINQINREFGVRLPLQILFSLSTIEQLASEVDREVPVVASRLVRLRASGSGNPLYCWPGLGGYTMNLRRLAAGLDADRPVYGIQAYGINEGEVAYPTVEEMAAHDVELIRRNQPSGPYTLCGYSFGAQVAFEAARQLEYSGARVDHLLLIAPGSPLLEAQGERAYRTILFTVFAGTLDDPALRSYHSVPHDEDSQVAYFVRTFPHLDPDLTRRIMAVVRQTYRFKESFAAMADRRVAAPVTIFQTRGDDRDFVDTCDFSATRVIELEADHYSTLKEPDVHELLRLIAQLLKK
ncbi:hypothetical protein Rhe02_32390 [Rhizocola hellebori]|uniref:Carrier domain-containing protein n=1 Tax=Rhizocola hellebori TaxID=1392758 RepID=A0A8J3VGI2_9ACTN|nr:amino acid adenylation domain-containing protein [Rhizocola hellebori]GIH05172.1 hypothetical protein Rhe02_32390 [Rhizocola hellebori]